MKWNKIPGFLAALVFFVTHPAFAYETETHAVITLRAYQNSVLAQVGTGSVINRLGLDRLDQSSPFGVYWRTVPRPNSYYVDGGSTSGFQVGQGIGPSDEPEEFERCQMQEFLNDSVLIDYSNMFRSVVSDDGEDVTTDSVLPIQNWLVRGAIREDDMGGAGAGIFGTTWWFTNETHCGTLWRQTKQYPNLGRSLNHFFDPYYNIGLNALATGKRSVDWALGYVDSFAVEPQTDGARQNFYSYADARNMFWWALTRQNNRSEGLAYFADDRNADTVDRMFLWASVFRSLGNLIHLVEDTAQPQHTRNDPHGAHVSNSEQQAFEPYTNARILGGQDVGGYVRSFFGDEKVNLTPPPLGIYGAIAFSTPARFFSTRGSDSNQMTRAGLADYTNRGFFTGGTLPGSAVLAGLSEPNPTSDLTQGYTVVQTPCEQLQSAADGRLKDTLCKHYTRAVPDVVNPGYLDQLPQNYTLPPLASESIVQELDAALGAPHDVPELAIGIAELDTMGNMTIPRAVAYATGMLNYFFRGQLTLSSPPRWPLCGNRSGHAASSIQRRHSHAVRWCNHIRFQDLALTSKKRHRGR